MTKQQLEERIQKTTEKIEKKKGTILKKQKLIEKKRAAAEKTTDEHDKYWLESEMGWLQSDIKRIEKEIPEIEATLVKYQKQLAGELEKEALFATEMPEQFTALKDELVVRWDKYDRQRRDIIQSDYRLMEYKEWCKKYNAHEKTVVRYWTDEQIHNNNLRDAEALIIDLYNRVKEITGEVTDWKGIRASQGNTFPVLTGKVIGKEGIAVVETILAGGYNIQRLHVRTLVHAM